MYIKQPVQQIVDNTEKLLLFSYIKINCVPVPANSKYRGIYYSAWLQEMYIWIINLKAIIKLLSAFYAIYKHSHLS